MGHFLKFTFTMQRRTKGGFISLPPMEWSTRVNADKIDYPDLHKAELAFLAWFQTNHPNEQLVTWTSSTEHWPRCSEYRAYLPAMGPVK